MNQLINDCQPVAGDSITTRTLKEEALKDMKERIPKVISTDHWIALTLNPLTRHAAKMC